MASAGTALPSALEVTDLEKHRDTLILQKPFISTHKCVCFPLEFCPVKAGTLQGWARNGAEGRGTRTSLCYVSFQDFLLYLYSSSNAETPMKAACCKVKRQKTAAISTNILPKQGREEKRKTDGSSWREKLRQQREVQCFAQGHIRSLYQGWELSPDFGVKFTHKTTHSFCASLGQCHLFYNTTHIKTTIAQQTPGTAGFGNIFIFLCEPHTSHLVLRSKFWFIPQFW